MPLTVQGHASLPHDGLGAGSCGSNLSGCRPCLPPPEEEKKVTTAIGASRADSDGYGFGRLWIRTAVESKRVQTSWVMTLIPRTINTAPVTASSRRRTASERITPASRDIQAANINSQASPIARKIPERRRVLAKTGSPGSTN